MENLEDISDSTRIDYSPNNLQENIIDSVIATAIACYLSYKAISQLPGLTPGLYQFCSDITQYLQIPS
jgi:hypothetical protein